MTVSDEVARRGIASDVAYVERLTRDLNASEDAFRITAWFCIVPYLSLIVHESARKPQYVDPTVLTLLSQDAATISARSRHSLKLFEDSKRGVDGQIKYFRDEITAAHSEAFLGNTWLRPARRFEKDLGLFFYDGKLITTTHAATFHLGVDPRTLLADDSGPYVRAIYEEFGRYFRLLGARADTQGPSTFIAHLVADSFGRPKNVRGSRYYGSAFNGGGTPEINGALTGFQAMINFVDATLTVGANVQQLEYTVFKMRYITLLSILRSLRLLHENPTYSLSPKSKMAVHNAIGSPDAVVLLKEDAKPFRNTLMHYDLDSRVDITRVDLDQPLFGLVPIYFPSHDITAFADLVDRCIKNTARALNEWAVA